MIAIDKLLTIILVAFVIGLVFAGLFKADINRYLRNAIPDYTTPDHEEVNEIPVVDGCVKIGKISASEENRGSWLLFCPDEGCAKKDFSNVNLYVSDDKIKVSQTGVFGDLDEVVGGVSWEKRDEIEVGVLEIDIKVLYNFGSLFEEVRRDIPVNSVLKRLDTSYVLGQYICKDDLDLGKHCPEGFSNIGFSDRGVLYDCVDSNCVNSLPSYFGILGEDVIYSNSRNMEILIRDTMSRYGYWEVGSFSQNKISINDGFLNLEAWPYQKIRFLNKKPYDISEFADMDRLLVHGNLLCKEDSDLEYVKAVVEQKSWPYLDNLEIEVRGDFGTLGGFSGFVNWIPWIGDSLVSDVILVNFGDNMVKDDEAYDNLKFTYMDGYDYIAISFYRNRPIGRIYPDGSIWFSSNKGFFLSGKRIYSFGEDVEFKFRESFTEFPDGYSSSLVMSMFDPIYYSKKFNDHPQYESNLKLPAEDYQKIIEGIDK